VKITGLNRFVHELVQLIGKLNGDSGHGGGMVSRLARFVESMMQRRESSALTCGSSSRSAECITFPACDERGVPV